MKTTCWVYIMILSMLLLLVALSPYYLPIKPAVWILSVSVYYAASFLWLVIKTWNQRHLGLYIAVYVWVGAMIYAVIQGMSERQIMNSILAGCLVGILVGGFAGYVFNSIKHSKRG